MFKPENYFYRWLLLIIAMQACLLALGLQVKSFTADECYELRHLSLDPVKVANDGDGFPPLFRWLLSMSIYLTGEPLSRGMPMITSLLGTWVVAMAGRRIASERGGLIGALFFSLSACQLEYAQQLRAYSLYILAVACMLWAFFSLVSEWKNKYWVYLVVFTSVALLTHYFALLVAMVLWIALGITVLQNQVSAPQESRFDGCSFSKLVIAAISCALIGVPFLYALRVDLSQPPPAEVVNPVDLTSIAYLYLSLAQGWCVGPSSIELQSLPFQDAIFQIAPWAILSFGASISLVWFAWRDGPWRAVWVLLGLLTIPTLIAVLLSLMLGFSFVSRYLACLVVPVALMVGIACDRRGNRALLALSVLLVVNVLSFYNRNWTERYDRENYRAVVELISQSDPSPRVLVLSHYVSHAMRRAAPANWEIIPVRFYSDDPSDSEQMASPNESQRIAGAWVVAEWFPARSELAEKRARELDQLEATFVSKVCSNIELFRIKSHEPGSTAEP